MKDKIKLAIVLIVAIVLALAVREIWPKEKLVHTDPEIVTVWDTVSDTAFVQVEVPVEVPGPEVIRTVIVTEVDTVPVTPELPSIFGITRIRVAGRGWGDTVSVQGFSLEVDNTGNLLRREWRAEYFAMGPIEAVVVDSIPARIVFFPIEEEDPNRCPFLLNVIPMPCDPAFTAGGMYQLVPTSTFPFSVFGLGDVAFGSKRIRAGVLTLLTTSDLYVFLTVGYRF